MVGKIHEWNEIKDKYTESIILGNGSSIAIHENFRYTSLHERATELNFINSDLNTLFERFGTNDFEAIMHKLLQAEAVNDSLLIDSEPVKNAYDACRTALIKVVQNIHPEFHAINDGELDNIAIFLKNFKKVISLNYDLILYWAMYRGNQPDRNDEGNVIERGNLFKDCFTESSNGDKCFNFDWELLEEPHGTRKNAILVFYLHGNLSLASFIKNKVYELDVKIASPDDSHLDAIFKKWKNGNYSPLVVCEGESKRKLASIKSSNYLSAVYYDVFNTLGESIAIYGFNFNDQDDHIISRLYDVHKKHPMKCMAISVCNDGNQEIYMKRVRDIINHKFGKNMAVEFFKANSKNCWNNGS